MEWPWAKTLLEKMKGLACGVTEIPGSFYRKVANAAGGASEAYPSVDDKAVTGLPADFGSRSGVGHVAELPTLPWPALYELNSRSSELTEEQASRIHEIWRKPRLLEGGGYVPRLEQVRNDQEWIAAHGTEVDIANTSYRDLPIDYQQENQESAKVALPAVLNEYLSGRDPSRSDFIEEAGSRVHDAWLERNRDWAPPDQSVRYGDLTDSLILQHYPQSC
ncbi:hypothetical protein [Nocardia sp. NBC_01327]|uniref:hypothetical protein n=1 Tax=Nocardia sp. NBC_01327 TaxID=2903593 RepID=UPI002E0E058A|nr:hypothetical protein OG326_42955 [Nocardia sp. NBC_01327]